jgi:hypothetical protein
VPEAAEPRENICPLFTPDVSLETILVAVIAGLGGGLAGTWLQIRHEREEAFRERQINAADDLSTGLAQAVIGLDTEALAAARRLIGEARAQTARVAVLFGHVSSPDRCATLTLIHLDGTLLALDAWPLPKLDQASEELAGARKYLADFNTYALREA